MNGLSRTVGNQRQSRPCRGTTVGEGGKGKNMKGRIRRGENKSESTGEEIGVFLRKQYKEQDQI
jgi:hypothetical protein